MCVCVCVCVCVFVFTMHRVAALTSQIIRLNMQKNAKFNVQWQLSRNYCPPGHIAAQFSWHGNCTTATVDTVVVGKFQLMAFLGSL